MSMLVEVAFVNQGVVKDCQEVTEYTSKYRQSQDAILCFFAAKIERVPNKKCQIAMTNLHRSFKEWYNFNYNDKYIPKNKEIDTAMNKMYGDKLLNPSKKWCGVRIILEIETPGKGNGEEEDEGEEEGDFETV